MKLIRSIALPVLSLIILSSSCKKHVIKPVDQLSLLPPATQTGARTFGCLVNGQAFVPKDRSIIEGPLLQCNYIFLNGGYYFLLALVNSNNGLVQGVRVATDSLAIAQGQSYKFAIYRKGNADAAYNLTGTQNRSYVTNTTVSGYLTITKLDPIMQIVSGTFYFKGINAPGDTVNVTDGRFDMPYTR
jgi:hypothetical protein